MPSSRIGIGRHTVRWRSALTLGIGLVLAPGIAAAARILEVRVGEHAEFTRVVFHLDGRTTYNVEPIAAGSREILVTLAAEGTLRNLPSKSPLLAGVRISPGPGGTVAHLDLRSPDVHVTEMVLKGPDRVVLDLRPARAGAGTVAKATAPPAPKPVKAEPPQAKPQEAAQPTPPPVRTAKSEPSGGIKLVQTADKLEAVAVGTPQPGEGAPATAPGEPPKGGPGAPPAPVAAGEVTPPAVPVETAGEGAATIKVPAPEAGAAPGPPQEPGAPETGAVPPSRAPLPEPTPEPGAPPAPVTPEPPTAAPTPERVPEAPRKAAPPPPPAPTSPSLTERLGDPYVLGGLVAFVLVLLLVWRSLRRRAVEGAPALPFPPEEVEEPIEFEAEGAEAAPDGRYAPEPAPPAEEPAEMGSLFEVSEEPEPKGATAMEPVTSLAPPSPPGAVTPLPGVDLGTVIHELEQRIESLEVHLKELLDARERLERQVNAQTEELRVQRAAIARTQRVVRTLARPDDAGAETASKLD